MEVIMSSYLKLQNGSDVRGVALEGVPGESVNLTHIETYHIAISFAKWLSVKLNKPTDALRISVGCDSRLSAKSLKKGIFSGLASCSVTPYDCGITSTPSVFMSTVFEESQFDGGIMLTASHLPFNKNGMKFFTRQGGLNKTDIHTLLSSIVPTDYIEDLSTVKEFDLVKHYSQHIVQMIRDGVNADDYNQPLKNMHIIVDAGNGAGGFFADHVLRPLGADTSGSQFLDPDGNFPNHIPNPEDTDAINSIIHATLKTNADLGIIFDTDVDRAAVIDHDGQAINRNKLIALMSAITLSEHPGSTIVTDSVTSDGLEKFITELGGHHHRFKRGYKNVIDESIRLNNEGIPSHLAIETSGHGAFKDNYFLDDGAYIVTKILIILAQLRKENKDISDLITTLEEPKDAVEIRLTIKEDDFKSYGQTILDDFKSYVSDNPHYTLVSPNYEGVRVNYDFDGIKGWVLIRLSLHDPVIPINIESTNENGCDIAQKDLFAFLEAYDQLAK
jgi:phosphomannomutase